MAGWYFPPTGLPFIPIHPRFFLSSSRHYAPIFAIICDFCPHLLAGKQPREQIQELFLFDPVAKLPINMNLLLTKKWKGTSLQNEHPLPSPYFLEKNASLFLSFHRVHASFSLLFFLFFVTFPGYFSIILLVYLSPPSPFVFWTRRAGSLWLFLNSTLLLHPPSFSIREFRAYPRRASPLPRSLSTPNPSFPSPTFRDATE